MKDQRRKNKGQQEWLISPQATTLVDHAQSETVAWRHPSACLTSSTAPRLVGDRSRAPQATAILHYRRSKRATQ